MNSTARLESTRRSGPAALYDVHARDLLGLASLLLDDRDEAEAVVVHVLCETALRRPSDDDRADRRVLARAVFLRATRARLGSGPLPHRPAGGSGPCSPSSGGHPLTVLSDPQRAVIALSLYGAHSRSHTADLLSLPASVVDELLRTGLHRIRVGH